MADQLPGPLAGLSFTVGAPVWIVVDQWANDAVAATRVGEQVTFARWDDESGTRVAALSVRGKVLGYLDQSSPAFAKLLSGRHYRADIGRIAPGRYGRRFDAIQVDLTFVAPGDD